MAKSNDEPAGTQFQLFSELQVQQKVQI